MDNLNKEKRSWNMSRIHSKNTKPELKVRSYLHKHGLRFRLYKKELPGKPDLFLPKFKTAVFINGCFWHQHKGCLRNNVPKSNRKYWKNKLKSNIIRDKKNIKKNNQLGYKVIIIWECQVDNNKLLNSVIKEIKSEKK